MHNLDSHVKTRFCPSPTGLLHLGNLRTALFSALLAKSVGGQFLLRIEDTDLQRSEERYIKSLLQDLLWVGLLWQEGPECDKGHGPYRQSQRGAIYADYYQRLEAMGATYPCYCTEEELAIVRKIQRSTGKPPRYPGTCQELTAFQIAQKEAEGRRPTLRFRIPAHYQIRFTDLVRGEQSFQSDDLGDFIIRRADGGASFLFCNALDDALMEVSHVVRGEDHVTNTPRQILILETLGLSIPDYAHIAMIVGPDGSPLSKRLGSLSIVQLREAGYLPLAVINYLARLGHYYGHDQLLSLEELAAQFRVDALSTSPAKFNQEQLNFWQKRSLESLSIDQWLDWLGEEITEKIPLAKQVQFAEMIKPNIQFPAEALPWVQIIFGEELPEIGDLQTTNPDYFSHAWDAFEQHDGNTQKIWHYLKDKCALSGKALYQPLRIALTGMTHGPELEKILLLMNPKKIKQCLQRAQEYVKNFQQPH